MDLLEELFDFASEIDERCPGYSTRFPLRVSAPPEILARLREACSLPLANGEPVNAVDRLFAVRTAGVEWPPNLSVQQIRTARANWLAARDARDSLVARMPAIFERKTVNSADGALEYFSYGQGPRTVILLNAIGQGTRYWFRLILELERRGYRSILWELRGTHTGRWFSLADQIADIGAVIRHEDLRDCLLVGWCTAAKIATEFCVRNPGLVSAMVLLNSTLKRAGGPVALDTPYERNFEPVCRLLTKNPDMAAPMIRSLRDVLSEKDPDQATWNDPAAIGARALSTVNTQLRQEVMAPFRNAFSLMNYCRQSVDFWAYDIAAHSSGVRVPLLLVASENDRVANPAVSEQAARLFPSAQYRAIPGATHYCLFDQPRLIGQWIDEFFRDSASALT